MVVFVCFVVSSGLWNRPRAPHMQAICNKMTGRLVPSAVEPHAADAMLTGPLKHPAAPEQGATDGPPSSAHAAVRLANKMRAQTPGQAPAGETFPVGRCPVWVQSVSSLALTIETNICRRRPWANLLLLWSRNDSAFVLARHVVGRTRHAPCALPRVRCLPQVKETGPHARLQPGASGRRHGAVPSEE